MFRRMVLPIYAEDQYRVYRLQPNLSYRHTTNEYDVTYHTNNQSVRADQQKKEVDIRKAKDTFRVLFLGPSFTFGWANNYEDTYASIIEREIAIAGKDIEVINLGTPAQPIAYQLCWLQEIGYKFKPDMIIQTVYGYPGNIATKCQEPSNRPIVKAGYLYTARVTLGKKLFEAAKTSAIVLYGWYIYQALSSPGNESVGLGTELYESAELDLSVGSHGINPDDYTDYIRYVKEAAKQEVAVVFIHIPFSYVVRPSDLSRWKHRGWENPYVLRRIADEIETLLNQNGVPFVNPIDELASKDQIARTFYFLDLHLTPFGNRVLAESAIPVIREAITSHINDQER